MKSNLFILIVFLICNLYVINSYSQTDKGAVIDDSKVINEYNLTFSYGGESKLALFLPKFEYLRIHQSKPINLFYGGSLGIHGALVTGYGSLSAIAGMEYKNIDFNGSLSHFRSLKAKIDETESVGPFSQNLINFKFGIRVNEFRLRIGTSILINETAPVNQDRISLLDIGKIGNRLWLIEFQSILNRN